MRAGEDPAEVLLRVFVLWLMVLGGIVAAIVLEARDRLLSFVAGVVAALILPRLWRWVDRNE